VKDQGTTIGERPKMDFRFAMFGKMHRKGENVFTAKLAKATAVHR
jgi:hypothetical protein